MNRNPPEPSGSPAPAIAGRLAVCSWSLQPANLADLIAKLKDTGISRVQLALDPLRECPADWADAATRLPAAGISLVSGMFGCVGEDYSTLDSIRLTGGLAPDGTWERNLENLQATARLAAALGLRLVTFHAGFLPEDETSPAFAKMLARLSIAAEIFDREKIGLALETGQETAPVLAGVLKQPGTSGLGVNFDPANMLLYGKGNPVEALRVLGPWIRQVHIKDARSARIPGAWGEEVAAGSGEVDWPQFFSTLREIHFLGHLVIEREAGAQRVADICAARDLVLRFNE